MDVPLTDLQVGRYYKLKEPFTLTDELQGNGTLQEDIDLLANEYYKLQSFDEDSFDAEFALPSGMTVHVPAGPESNQRETDRPYIFITGAALPDGEDTLFLEMIDEQPNIVAPVPDTENTNNPFENENGRGLSGGKRKKRQSKKRKTVKKSKRKQTRKQKHKSRRRRM
jgi:hypothetical protein